LFSQEKEKLHNERADMTIKIAELLIEAGCRPFYRHISTNNEANRKFVILISNFSTSLRRFKPKMHCGIEI
jgi:hypothetical protein